MIIRNILILGKQVGLGMSHLLDPSLHRIGRMHLSAASEGAFLTRQLRRAAVMQSAPQM